MARLVPAGKQLIEEVAGLFPKAEAIASEEDGYGYLRRVTFNIGNADLKQALELVGEADNRIASVSRSARKVWVDFVPSTKPDWSHPFGLADVYSVLVD